MGDSDRLVGAQQRGEVRVVAADQGHDPHVLGVAQSQAAIAGGDLHAEEPELSQPFDDVLGILAGAVDGVGPDPSAEEGLGEFQERDHRRSYRRLQIEIVDEIQPIVARKELLQEALAAPFALPGRLRGAPGSFLAGVPVHGFGWCTPRSRCFPAPRSSGCGETPRSIPGVRVGRERWFTYLNPPLPLGPTAGCSVRSPGWGVVTPASVILAPPLPVRRNFLPGLEYARSASRRVSGGEWVTTSQGRESASDRAAGTAGKRERHRWLGLGRRRAPSRSGRCSWSRVATMGLATAMTCPKPTAA